MNARFFTYLFLGSIFLCVYEGLVLFLHSRSDSVEVRLRPSEFRRNSILWPLDCEYGARSSGSNEKSELPSEVCADAVETIRKKIPNDCDFTSIEKDKNGFVDLHRYADFLNETPLRFFSLGNGIFLGELLCQRSAYNQNRIYFIYDERFIPATTKLLTFTAYEFRLAKDGSIQRTPFESVNWIRFYDPEHKEFIAFLKGRGMGDCGRYFRYRLTNQNEPILSEMRAKLECDGRNPYSSEEIPLLWQKYEEPFDPLFAFKTKIRKLMEKKFPQSCLFLSRKVSETDLTYPLE
ncbi:DUF1176 domain-containing protein [Leptospira gomenensis]|uniref:DUF1176 domain-containing protein n=1 Tax=Leptospira gomenensis TaxID=2484974 RepID=A0A5F1YF46_9LEPT|nr:DUF1176 domain-containing protein [Leptospira gomenensis]TGK37480.1 DUF1176 domain-containing protein [Leptospira gomenensis]TGK39514.1 DUF1176 domain-containing protein [Leptospira gomenensis]TGK43065.1 DUF1176 domain-containing protein [Leptospira gomenensis]TGK54329.1 DUF1176 domain-containing protein [Leptospira gomenensis]